MRSNIERTAWIILSTAFGIFCLLAILIPASIRWYIINATESFATEVTSVRGTVVIGDPNTGSSSSLTDGNTITFTHEEWVKLNLRHAELHLGNQVPT